MRHLSSPSRVPLAVPLAVLLAIPAAVAGQAPPVDKSAYSLFNPTPREHMRELSADRPDGTESPITVDAGHLQVELSFFDYVHDDDGAAHVDAWTVFDTNLKLGLNPSTDVQFVFQAFTEEKTTVAGASDHTVEGFSDVQVRLKVNLWGNDGEPDAPTLLGAATAVGVMPFVKIPTGTSVSNDHVEGGLIAMLGWDLGETWGLGFMVEGDAVYDDDGDYDFEFVHTAVIGFDVVGPLGAYLEYIGILSTDSADEYQPLISGGLTYALGPDLVFDIGMRVGLDQSAEDVAAFVGLTFRY